MKDDCWSSAVRSVDVFGLKSCPWHFVNILFMNMLIRKYKADHPAGSSGEAVE